MYLVHRIVRRAKLFGRVKLFAGCIALTKSRQEYRKLEQLAKTHDADKRKWEM